MGDSWDSHGRLPGALPAPAEPRNLSQAYDQRAEGSFREFERLGKAGQRRWALSGGARCAPGTPSWRARASASMVEYGIKKPSSKLLAVADLDSDTWV